MLLSSQHRELSFLYAAAQLQWERCKEINNGFCTHTDQQESYTILLILLPLAGNCPNLSRVTAHDLIMSDPSRCNLNNVSIDQLKLNLLSDPPLEKNLCSLLTWTCSLQRVFAIWFSVSLPEANLMYATSDDSSDLVNTSSHFSASGCPGANLQFEGISLLRASTSLWTICLAMKNCHVT